MKRKKRRRNLKIFLTIFLIIGTMIFLRKSPMFNLAQINVKGNVNTEKENITKMSQLDLGSNIFTVKTKKVKKNIEEIPYIKSVAVKRKLPNQIELKVTERTEVIQVKGDSLFYKVDADGILIDETDIVEPNRAIVFGLDLSKAKLGDNLFKVIGKEPILEEIKGIEDKEILKEIKEINILETEIKVRLFREIDVIFEDFNDLNYKMKMLREVLNHIDENEINCSIIFMNKGENPVIVTGNNEG